MFGWDNPKQAAVYTRKANRTKLTKGAMHPLVSGNESKKSEKCPTGPKVRHSARKSAGASSA